MLWNSGRTLQNLIKTVIVFIVIIQGSAHRHSFQCIRIRLYDDQNNTGDDDKYPSFIVIAYRDRKLCSWGLTAINWDT